MNQHLHLKPLLTFAMLMIVSLLVAHAIAEDNSDFSLQANVNGDDLSELETIVIDPERELTIDLHIFDVARELTLEKISVAVMFAGQTVFTLSEHLNSFPVPAGGDYRERITVNTREALKRGNLTLATGIYRTGIELEYTIGDQRKVWSELKNVRITGNPLGTPLGAAGVVVSGIATAFILMLTRSLVAPGLAAGTTLPASTAVTSFPRLYDLALERLEPTARGRVVGNIVKTAKKRIMKDRCPICDTRLKHGYCYTCKKSAKEVRNEYIERVRDLTLQGSKLLTSGQVATLDDLSSRLGISTKLGTDVIATLKNAKLVKVKGIVRKLTGKVVTAGISSGLSTVLWITVGGFAVLSASALIAILIVSVVIPVAVVKSLQMKAKRALKK